MCVLMFAENHYWKRDQGCLSRIPQSAHTDWFLKTQQRLPGKVCDTYTCRLHKRDGPRQGGKTGGDPRRALSFANERLHDQRLLSIQGIAVTQSLQTVKEREKRSTSQQVMHIRHQEREAEMGLRGWRIMTIIRVECKQRLLLPFFSSCRS